MPLTLVGDWIAASAVRYSLHEDGTCTIAVGDTFAPWNGSWRMLGDDAFELAIPRPGGTGSAADEVTHFQILHRHLDSLLVEGREGGADGPVQDAVEWVRAEPIY